MVKVAVKKQQSKMAGVFLAPKSEPDAHVYVLTEKQLVLRVSNGDKRREEKKHVFETQFECAQYWEERWAKLVAKGFEQVVLSGGDTRVIMKREENGYVYTLIFDGKSEPRVQPKTADAFVGPDGVRRTDAEVDDAFDIGDFKAPEVPDQESEEPGTCRTCVGKGTMRVKGIDRKCMACKGTGFKPGAGANDWAAKASDPHIEQKNRFAAQERKQEEAAFLNDPDFRADQAAQKGSKFVEAKAAVSPRRDLPLCTYTVIGDGFEGGYRTIRLRETDFKDGKKVVIDYMVGPDNENDFIGCGFLFQEQGRVTLWKRFRAPEIEPEFEQEIRLAIDAIYNNPKAAGLAYAKMSGNCCVCGRKLTTPESLEAGIGPVCMEKAGW
jgi:hypothetical protein